MKKILLTVAVLFSAQLLVAQSDTIDLSGLEVPNTPGFQLLDDAPTLVDRPQTAKAFAASIFNSVKQSKGLPTNYAAEFTPYWWFKPHLTAATYQGYDSSYTKTKIFSQLRFASVSLAFVNTSDTLFNAASGLRATLIRVPRKTDLNELKSLNQQINSFTEKVNQQMLLSDLQPFSPAWTKMRDSLLAAYENSPELNAMQRQVDEIISRQPIFTLDGAVAMNIAFTNDQFSSGSLSRSGAWLTGSLSLDLHKKEKANVSNYLNFYFTGRYLMDKTQRDSTGIIQNSSLFDLGGKLELEIDRFSLSYEYLLRTNLDDAAQNTFRASGMAKYKVKEGVYLHVALGRNFGSVKNLISQFGLAYGIGNERVRSK